MNNNNSKKLVLYVFHEITENVKFFLNNAVFEHPNIDFIFISQGCDTSSIVCKKNMTIIKRQNLGRDFGGWSDVILTKVNIKLYDYFIFINSTCIGPFLPGYCKTNEWPDMMIKMIDNETKLVGPTIGNHNYHFHVQSYCFATDQIGLNILIKTEIFKVEMKPEPYEVILDQEVLMSHEIISAGYNIGCFLLCFRGIDFRTRKTIENVPQFYDATQVSLGHYWGFGYQPPEVLFYKLRSSVDLRILGVYKDFFGDKNELFSKLPRQFGLPGTFAQDYKEFNPDLKNFNYEQLKQHFLLHGKGDKENRAYESKLYKLSVHPKELTDYKIEGMLVIYKLIWRLFPKRKTLEIGGPSNRLFVEILPVYKCLTDLDIINFSNDTVWSKFSEDNRMNYYKGKSARTMVSDGLTLDNIQDETYELFLASHVLEHLANPLKALTNWLRVLKPQGILLLVLPKKETTFDHKRQITKFSLLLEKLKKNVGEDDLSSLPEILELHDLSRDLAAPQDPQKFKERCMNNFNNRTLHHHVFSMDLLHEIGDYFKLKFLGEVIYDNHDQIILFQK